MLLFGVFLQGIPERFTQQFLHFFLGIFIVGIWEDVRAIWSNCTAISRRRGRRVVLFNLMQVFIISHILRIGIFGLAHLMQVESFLLLALLLQFGVLTVNHVNLLHDHFEVVLLLSREKIIGFHAEDDRCTWWLLHQFLALFILRHLSFVYNQCVAGFLFSRSGLLGSFELILCWLLCLRNNGSVRQYLLRENVSSRSKQSSWCFMVFITCFIFLRPYTFEIDRSFLCWKSITVNMVRFIRLS